MFLIILNGDCDTYLSSLLANFISLLILYNNFSGTIWRPDSTLVLAFNDDASAHDGVTFDNDPDGSGNSLCSGGSF